MSANLIYPSVNIYNWNHGYKFGLIPRAERRQLHVVFLRSLLVVRAWIIAPNHVFVIVLVALNEKLFNY